MCQIFLLLKKFIIYEKLKISQLPLLTDILFVATLKNYSARCHYYFFLNLILIFIPMALEPQAQLRKFLEKSQKILILIPENPETDAIGSSWALYYFLKKINLQPAIAFSGKIPEKFGFLPVPEKFFSEISGARDFVLSFDTTRNKIIRVRQKEEDDRYNIFVTPKKGSIDPRDFSFILAKFNYDLVVTIDCSDLEKLGSIYIKNTDLFFEVPVANIDYHSENDNFGQINLVDITASSSAEILFELFQNINPEMIDQNISTCLFTGLIGATESFQKKNTTPKALSFAAQLMEKKANQSEIVRWLYKTQPLRILKLWGRAMAKINWEEEIQLVWSAISVEDLVQSRGTISDLPIVLEKIQESYSEGKFFMTIYNDTPQSSVALIKTKASKLAQKIYPFLNGNFQNGILEIKIEEEKNLEKTGLALTRKIQKLLSQ